MGNKSGGKSNNLWAWKKIVYEGIKYAPDLNKYGKLKLKLRK